MKDNITTADKNVSTMVRMLVAAERGTIDGVAKTLSVDRSTVFGKLSGRRRWYASEVQGLADYFGVPVIKFFAGAESLIHGLSTTSDGQVPLFDFPLAS